MIDVDSRYSQRFEVVGQTSAFTRKKSYEVVLDFLTGQMHMQRSKAMTTAKSSNADEDTPQVPGSLSRGRTKRILQQRASAFRSRSVRQHNVHSYRCEDFVKMTKLDQISALRVVIGKGSGKDSKAKTFWFGKEQERELFVKLIHAYITHGSEARNLFNSSATRESGKSHANGGPALATFCEYLLEYANRVNESPPPSINISVEPAEHPDDATGDGSTTATAPSMKRPLKQTSAGTVLELSQAKNAILRGQLLLGEVITMRQEHTLWIERQSRIRGVLIVTNYRLVFLSYRNSDKTSSSTNMVEVPLATFSRLEKAGNTALELLILHCKDLRTLSFGFDASDSWFNGFVDTLQKIAFPERQERSFAFSHRLQVASDESDGWKFFDAMEHYLEMGLNSDGFRITNINEDYTLCSTYPRYIVVPASFSDEQLQQASLFRSRERLPAITWRHPKTLAVLARCSQPLTGLKGKRNEMDELLVGAIREANPTNSDVLYILDARPFKAAVGNTVMGKGYENTAYYTKCELQFLGIDNIHVVRSCLERVVEVTNVDNPNYDESTFLSRVESTQWIHYIRLLLSAAVTICDMMADEGASVVTHCSDGWDRTSQLCALAQLMLDPYYRTLKGFAVLIEKEWLSFGHKFAERCGHCSANFSDDQRAPIFLQFLDCAWQVLVQFPLAFEFNESFLLAIATNLYSCRFGTFLFDNEQEREKHRVRQRTTSLWTCLCSEGVRERYINPMFAFASPTSRLVPIVNAQSILLWQNMYQRWRKLPENQASLHSTCALVTEKYRRARALLHEHGIEFDDIELEVENAMAKCLAPDLDLKAVSFPSPPPKALSHCSVSAMSESDTATRLDRSVSPLRLPNTLSSSSSGANASHVAMLLPTAAAAAAAVPDASAQPAYAASFVPSWLWGTSGSAAAVANAANDQSGEGD